MMLPTTVGENGGGADVAGVGHVVPALALAGGPALPHPTRAQMAPHHLPQTTPCCRCVVQVVQETDKSLSTGAARGKVPTPFPLQLLLHTRPERLPTGELRVQWEGGVQQLIVHILDNWREHFFIETMKYTCIPSFTSMRTIKY